MNKIPGHTDAPEYRDPTGSQCVTKCNTKLPKGTKAYCYANEDSTSPDTDQFCGFEQHGFVVGAPGCCEYSCPSEQCPGKKKPQKYAPSPSSRDEDKPKPKDDAPKPLPQLMKMILLLLAILVVTAGIFIAVSYK